MKGATVLIVEDDRHLASFLATALTGAGYRVLQANDARQALSTAEQYAPDVLLVDLGLPDRDGIEVVIGVRKWSRAPILVISARGQEAQKVQLLDAGADDYLTKPFGFDELTARLRALLRRAQTPAIASDFGEFQCGPLGIDVQARRVRVDGREIHLTPIEWKLLLALARQSGRIVTQRQLLIEVWGPQRTDSGNYLRVYMTHLRRKLGSAANVLRTEAGVGYGLECPEALR